MTRLVAREAELTPAAANGASVSRVDVRELLDQAKRLLRNGAEAFEVVGRRKAAACSAYESARDEVVARQLGEMPLARLRETTGGGVRFGAIEKAGYRTVGRWPVWRRSV